MNILALDASSVAIGWVRWDGAQALAHGTVKLERAEHRALPRHEALLRRMALAEVVVADLLRQHAPDVVALEGPTTRHASHVIAQQRVCGVLLLAIHRAGLLSLEIAPSTAKKALTGKGNADKSAMQRAAAYHLTGADEHACDALGVAMAAAPLVKVGEAV